MPENKQLDPVVTEEQAKSWYPDPVPGDGLWSFVHDELCTEPTRVSVALARIRTAIHELQVVEAGLLRFQEERFHE